MFLFAHHTAEHSATINLPVFVGIAVVILGVIVIRRVFK